MSTLWAMVWVAGFLLSGIGILRYAVLGGIEEQLSGIRSGLASLDDIGEIADEALYGQNEDHFSRAFPGERRPE